MLKLNKDLMENKQGFVMICLAIFLVLFAVGIIFVIWLVFFGGIGTIANMCLLLAVPLLLLIVCAILAKKYLFNKGGK